MTRKTQVDQDQIVDLLEKILVFQLHKLGVIQSRIAKIIGREKAWVNNLVKGVQKGGHKNG